MNSDVIERTRRYVRENFLYATPDAELREDDDLLAGGVIDSVGVLELVEFLQESFGLSIPESDITEGNLGSLAAIARYVHARRDAKEGQRLQPRLAG